MKRPSTVHTFAFLFFSAVSRDNDVINLSVTSATMTARGWPAGDRPVPNNSDKISRNEGTLYRYIRRSFRCIANLWVG